MLKTLFTLYFDEKYSALKTNGYYMGVGVSLMRFKYPANQGNCDAIVIVETRLYQIMFSNKMHIFQFKKHEKLNFCIYC